MQKKDGKWFTRKKGAMLVLTLCLVGAAAATTYYAVDLSDTAQEPAKEHMVDLNESPVETEAEAVISSEAEANLASQANEMDVDPASLAGGNRQIRAEQETAGQETEAETEGMETEKVSSGQVNAVVSPTVSFASTQELQWPVAGKVLMDYSMDSTVYFATLDQYKYNPALIFGAEEGAQVVSAAKGIVDSITTNDETGTTIRMNLGDQYTLIYGQLENVAVAEGDVVERGQLLGYVAQPTKYYCKEGTHDLAIHFFVDLFDQVFQTHNAAVTCLERLSVFAVHRAEAKEGKSGIILYQFCLLCTAETLDKVQFLTFIYHVEDLIRMIQFHSLDDRRKVCRIIEGSPVRFQDHARRDFLGVRLFFDIYYKCSVIDIGITVIFEVFYHIRDVRLCIGLAFPEIKRYIQTFVILLQVCYGYIQDVF